MARPTSSPSTCWTLAGLLLLASAAASALAAAAHMRMLGHICGAGSIHCAWCGVAAGAALSGLCALAIAAWRPAPARGVLP